MQIITPKPNETLNNVRDDADGTKENSCEQRSVLDEAPVVLARLGQELMELEDADAPLHPPAPLTTEIAMCGGGGHDLLEHGKFLFHVFVSPSERLFASEIIEKWVRGAVANASNPGRRAYEIGRIVNELAVLAALKRLPVPCSTVFGFPAALRPRTPTPDCVGVGVRKVTVEAAARIDVAGGWSDTPPITYDLPHSAVMNLAVFVDGKRPIRCELHKLDFLEGFWVATGEGTLRCFETNSEILQNAQKPNEHGSLICAVIIAAGVVPGLATKTTKDLENASGSRKKPDFSAIGCRGLLIDCHSDLPHGSGLGTSSILSGAVLAALWTLFNREFSVHDIVKYVLKVEQFHSTGGGWQDQVGGLVPGLKLVSLTPTHEVHWRLLEVPGAFELALNKRLALVYTGRTRLAKDLLQKVLLTWMKGESGARGTFHTLVHDAESAASLLAHGNFPVQEVHRYHEAKKVLAEGAEPPVVTELMRTLREAAIVEACWIAGAGGGGFLYVWLAENRTIQDLRAFLSDNPQFRGLHANSVQIANEPLLINTF